MCKIPFGQLVPLLALFAALFLSTAAYAQTAQISGIVKDTDGGVIAAANVSVQNGATGASRATTTSLEGYYAFPGLPPGSYTLRVEKQSFTAEEYPNVVLPADSPVQFDVTLRVGDVADTVTVQAGVPSVENTAQLGMSVTRREYESLPMVQLGRIRSPASFVLLAPGVQGTVRLDGTQNANASNNVQVHGQANFTTEYLVNGLAAGPGYGNFNESAPAVGAVQEFRFITSQLTAEYGATGAAVASFVLRSGEHAVHGDFYDYSRNSALDEKSILTPTKPPLTLSEFGGSIGGPLASRTFFFFSYGGSRKRGADGGNTSLIPTAAQRLGDFSGLKDSAGREIVIYDPATTRVVNGVAVRDPFPGNVIPANRIDPAAAAIAALYPNPNSPGGFTGEFGETLLDPDAFTGTVDHNLSTGHRLSAAVVRTNIPRVRTGTSLPDPIQGNAFRQHVKSWTVRANDEAALGSRALNSLAVGYDAFTTPLIPPTDPRDWASTLHMPGLGTSAFPAITFGNGYQVLGSTNYFDYDDNTFLAKDMVSWQKGSHLLKFGGEWRYNRHDARVVGTTQGAFSFTNTLTASPAALTTTGDSFASFLLGGYRSVSATGPVNTSARWSYGGIYAADEWRANSSLTLTYGLRWEWQTPTREANNLSSEIDLTAPNPGAGNIPGALVVAGHGHDDDAFGKMDFGALGPRVGFNFRPRERIGIRGGYGIYYAKYTSGSNYFGIDSAGFQGVYSRTSTDNGLTPAGLLTQGLPSLAASATIAPTLLNGQSATYIDPSSWKLPRMQNWSIGFQHQLGPATTWEASYVGMRATRQNAYVMLNVNQVDSKYLALGSLLTQSATSPAAVAAGITLPYPGFTGTVAQALRPYPQYQTLTSFYAKSGENTYKAVELRLTQRVSKRVSFDIHYTWSRSEGYPDTVNIAPSGVNNLLADASHPENERSLLPIDVPHAVAASWIYEVPGSGMRNAFLRSVAGGWTIAGVHRYQSGTPLQIVSDNNLPLFNYVQRPNLVAGQDPQNHISAGDFNQATDRLINLAAFTAPAPFTVGNAPPTLGDLRNFPVLQEDLAITKRISLGEHWHVDLYGQAFNLFNRQRFTGIVTNFSSASFGKATGSSLPRFIQLGGKVSF